MQTQESYNTSSTMPTPPILSEVSISDGGNSSEVIESLDPKAVKKLWDQNQNKSQDKTSQSHKKKGIENIAQVTFKMHLCTTIPCFNPQNSNLDRHLKT